MRLKKSLNNPSIRHSNTYDILPYILRHTHGSNITKQRERWC